MVMRRKHWLAIGASILAGLVFIVYGLGGASGRAQLQPIILSNLTPLQAYVVSIWLPQIAVVLGSLLIIGIATKLIASFSAVPIVAFIANNSWMIFQGLGQWPKDKTIMPCCVEEIVQFSFIESLYLDVGLLALVLIIWLFYPGNLLTIRPWFLKKGKEGRNKGGK